MLAAKNISAGGRKEGTNGHTLNGIIGMGRPAPTCYRGEREQKGDFGGVN